MRRHVAISVFLVLFVAIVATANIPGHGVRDAVGKVDDPALAALGARQVWSVFAPDPNQAVGRVWVRFTYADGSSSIWRVPRGGALLHAYRDYRWLKLAENTARSSVAAEGLLLWAARHRAEPKQIKRVDLIRSVYDVAPPGEPKSHRGRTDTGVVVSLGVSG